jgi:hypothetical protein
MDGVFSKAALYIDNALGSFVTGMCGNCNNIEDDYEVLGANKSAVDAPIQIADHFIYPDDHFPWKN